MMSDDAISYDSFLHLGPSSCLSNQTLALSGLRGRASFQPPLSVHSGHH